MQVLSAYLFPIEPDPVKEDRKVEQSEHDFYKSKLDFMSLVYLLARP